MQARTGPTTPSPSADEQRGRLLLAMIEAVARDGYSDVKITDLTRIAGVSNSTFYAHFPGKAECFLATCRAIAAIGASRVETAFDAAEGDWHERARAGFAAFFSELSTESAAARLVLVDALSVGPRGAEQRLEAMAPFERILRHGLEESPQAERIDDTTMHAIVAGTLQLTYRHLRRGAADALHTLTDPVLDWTLAYHAAAAIAPGPPPAITDARVPDPQEFPAYAHGVPKPRTRIELAIIELVEEHGYGKLSMPAIAARARVSNATFYKHFANKEEAFLAIFDEIAGGAESATAAAVLAAPTWPRAIHDGIDALLTFLDRQTALVPLPLRGIYTGPPAALDRADALLDRFRDIFTPPLDMMPDPPPDPVIADAIIGGLWQLLQDHTAERPGIPLRTLTPQLTYLALAPFVGATEAVAAAAGDA